MIQRRTTHPLPRGNIRKAWGLVKAQLRKPGPLSRYVNTWQLFENDDTSDVPPSAWTLEMLPVLRLELDGAQVQWFNEVTQKTHVNYLFSFGIVGNDPGDLADFFEAFAAAIYPADKSLYGALKPFGVMSYSITGNGLKHVAYPDGRGMAASFSLTLLHELRTQY